MDRRKAKAIAKAFGVALKEARLSAGLTQQQLAEAVSVDPVFISYLENGRRQPSLSVVLLSERALGLDYGTLSARTAGQLVKLRR